MNMKKYMSIEKEVHILEEEIIHGESAFRRKKIFAVMIKYLCPIFVLIILISSVANAFRWISMSNNM